MVRGWCPDAWHPMAAGDGLLVRVRPRLGRMTVHETRVLCDAALAHGNGLIDLTNRAALQVRGVREAGWRDLVTRLIDAGLVDPDPAAEARGLTVVAPDWEAGDDSHRIATALRDRAADLPPLAAKIGFAIDAGPRPVLAAVPADFRIERTAHGGLMLRLDGRATGTAVLRDAEATALIALARWFAESGGNAAGRAARYTAALPGWADDGARPAPPDDRWRPGAHRRGAIFGLPFGQIDARRLVALLDRPGADAVRLSPWRMLLVEGLACTPAKGFVTDPAAPLLQIDACAGGPGCPQATVETRALARRLAPALGTRRLHVSGCAKGCAQPNPAAIVATGRDGRFDLGYAARAGEAPTEAGLDPDQLLAALERHDAARL